MSFPAILLSRPESGFHAELTTLQREQLPDADVHVAISHSTLNYKDGLAICNRSPVVRQWPMVAGIDGAGTVIDSRDPRWQAGDAVVLNGWGVGETHWGCLAGEARLKGDWLIRRPEALSARDCMIIGTAGYTAMLSVLALADHGVAPSHGEVLVTGAGGGVGSVAVALLAQRGFTVVASTGRVDALGESLTALGASEVVSRESLSQPGKPLQKERWAAVVDCVGSHTLANACAQTRYGGVVTACGLAQGMDFPASVAPFILRGVTLRGIDSVMAPRAARERAWATLATELDRATLDRLCSRDIGLDQVISTAGELMAGSVRGRVVVRVTG